MGHVKERVVLIGLLAGACSASTEPPRPALAGCYDPVIGPYALAKDVPGGREFQPAWVALASARSERGVGHALRVPKDFTFPWDTHGEWRPIGSDSVLIEWGSQHAGIRLRLAIEPDLLRGRGWFPQGDSSWSVTARRVPCGRDVGRVVG